MNTSAASLSTSRAWCTDCQTFVRGGTSLHVWTKKHQAVIAGPVVRRRSPRRVARQVQRRLVEAEPYTLDDPEPTWKLCRGNPSLDVAAHFEPLERFHRNVAYADGFYVKCHSCHQYYLAVLKARRELAQAA
jgi:hypothetical protein